MSEDLIISFSIGNRETNLQIHKAFGESKIQIIEFVIEGMMKGDSVMLTVESAGESLDGVEPYKNHIHSDETISGGVTISVNRVYDCSRTKLQLRISPNLVDGHEKLKRASLRYKTIDFEYDEELHESLNKSKVYLAN